MIQYFLLPLIKELLCSAFEKHTHNISIFSSL